MKNDPTYLFRLRELNQDDFLALLLGSWDNQSGLFFKEWSERDHVINSYTPTNSDRLYMYMDWGSAKPCAIGFFAVQPDRRVKLFDEIYTVKPFMNDAGMNYNAEEVADLIANRLKVMHSSLGQIPQMLILDSQCWAKDGSFGFSIAEIIQKKLEPFKVLVVQARKDRVNGWQLCRKYLIKEEGVPFFQVTKNCEHFIRTVPSLLHSGIIDGDIDSSMEDHHGDGWRYGLTYMPPPAHFSKIQLITKGSEAWFDYMDMKRSGVMS